jgi:predicted hydrocarbon binding protein
MPPSVPALIPLALLEAVQNIDTPPDDGLGALAEELAAKRLGLSPTVAAQVGRYREQVKAGGDVAEEEAAAVFRLVGRRPDAPLVFADAGRRAARYAAKRRGTAARALIAAAPGRVSLTLALRTSARLAERWLQAALVVSEGQLRCEIADSPGLRARDDGAGCQFYTAAFAELLRQVGGLEWSVVHETCQGRGDRRCVWRAMRAEGYE